MQSTKKEQCVEIRFMQKSGMNQIAIAHQLELVHGRNALSLTSVNRWFHRNLAGDDLKDKLRSGRPKKYTAAKVQEASDILDRDRRTSLHGLSRLLNISKGTTHKLVHKDLQMTKKSAKWVPHLLTQAQKDRRVAMARQSLAMLRRRVNPIHHVVVEDEPWIWAWDPESKRASQHWLKAGEECPEKPRQERSTQKLMLTVFFDEIGVIHQEITPNGLGIGGEIYRNMLQNFLVSLHDKRPDMFRDQQSWALLHDGAPAHIA